MKLVIVESPTKAKTISRFLGKDYVVESSFGHVRDLPRGALGVDPENDFEPKYVIPRKSQKTVTRLRKQASKAQEIILATDEDREGEAIAWHLVQALNNSKKKNNVALDVNKVERIVFHEITSTAILDALAHPRSINLDLVNAQQTRRVLDRLVGYKLSPFLWKKIARGLSAGRVQSVALRLIAEREETIKAFVPQEYFTVSAKFKTEKGDELEADLLALDGKDLPEPGIIGQDSADAILAKFKKADFKIESVEMKEMKRNPLPPFITSTLQQTAAQRLGFSAKKTMFIAQNLYERGLITYMRTDSVNLSAEALADASAWIRENLGEKYSLSQPRRFSSKSRLAQEAHEAIRPTKAGQTPEAMDIEKDFKRLYELIWRRFVASQLPPAAVSSTRIKVSGKSPAGEATLGTSGMVLLFDGFLKIWPSAFEDRVLPEVKNGERLAFLEGISEQHFTQPPPRYNEASLIKTLEKYGIGRPSTYAPTISIIQERNYVKKEQRYFVPTEIGTLVNKVLTENFPEIVDINFTAGMEDGLDEIATGKKEWKSIIRSFYEPFAAHLEEKYKEVSKKELTEEATDEICAKCGKPMLIKMGRFGKFMACSGYPDCKTTKNIAKEPPKTTGIKCPKCEEGELVERRVSRGRARGKMFWGCNRYPQCDHAVWQNPALTPERKAVAETPEKELDDA